MSGATTTYPEWDSNVVDWDEKPEPALIWQIIGGFSLYWALVAAVRLQIFDHLIGGSLPLEQLAAALKADVEKLGLVCDALVAVAILDGDRNGYRLNKTSRTLLVTSSDRYMGELVIESPGVLANWPGLAATVQGGPPDHDVDEDQGSFYARFARASFLTQLRAARFCATRLGLRDGRGRRILDLGAGGAPWTIAFLEACPESTAVVNDFPAVVEVAAEMCSLHGVSEKCEFIVGDYHQLDLDAGSFDILILGNVLRNEGPSGSVLLLRKAFTATRPGGRLVIADYFRGDNDRGPGPALLLGVTMVANTRSGSVYRHRDVAGWLLEAGFEHVRTIETVKRSHVLVAERASTS